ncbi:MAG: hypothetical protein WC564_03110 [Patescibacteria group bacterium]
MKLLNKLKTALSSTSTWGYIVVLSLIIIPWFLTPGYLFFTDYTLGPNISLDWANRSFLFNIMLKGLSFIFSIAFLEKIFISGVLLLILLGGRLLVKTILEYYSRDKAASSGLIFVLSLFTFFNPFVYDRALYGQFGVLIAYGFLLFVVSYLFKVFYRFDLKNIYFASIFTALALMFSVHFIFLLVPFYLLFLIGLFFQKKKAKKYGGIKNFWLVALSALLIILVINANWLVALATNSSQLGDFVEQGITSQDLVAFQTAGNNSWDTLNNVLLMSGFWGKDQLRYSDLTDIVGWQRGFILIIPIILYGVYLSLKKNKFLSIGLLIIFALSIFLAIGIKSPVTSGLTLFFYNHLPFYKGLREPQKWVAAIIPIYLFYLILGSFYLSKVKIIINNRLVSGLVLAFIIVMQAPLLFWGFNCQAKPIPYPSDWYEVDNLLSDGSNCSDRILFLPWHLYMSFNWSKKIMVNPARTFFSCPVISGTNMEWGGIYDNSRSADGAIIGDWLQNKGQGGVPALAGDPIRYIILAKELDFTSYLWLNSSFDVDLILETKTLLVYETKY